MRDDRDDRDELIDHIVDELKVLPVVPADATARVLARVDAARGHEDASARPGGWRRRFVVSIPAAIGYALAATLAGFMIRGAMPKHDTTGATVSERANDSTNGAAMRLQRVANAPATREAQDAPVATQFVLDAARASSVALVGDFNSWDASETPLVRDSSTGVWSAVVRVPPGRHLYAFLVDGNTWTLDPRAPKATDSDYGTEQSVVIVGLK